MWHPVTALTEYPRHVSAHVVLMGASGREHNHVVIPRSGLVIYLVKGGHMQSGDEATAEMMPGGLLGMEPDDEFFFGSDGGMAGLVET